MVALQEELDWLTYGSYALLAGHQFDVGNSMAERGDVTGGLYSMVEALRTAPDDSEDLARLKRNAILID